MSAAMPVGRLSGESAISFEDLVRRALSDDLSWNIFIADMGTATRAGALLLEWKRDVRHQRTIANARVTSGEWSRRDHAQWLIKVAHFERLIDKRRQGLPVPRPPVAPAAPDTVARLRGMNKSRLRTIRALVEQVNSFIEGEVGVNALSRVLAEVTVDLGKIGDVPLIEAHRAGMFDGVEVPDDATP